MSGDAANRPETQLIDRIYEAAVAGDTWSDVLGSLAAHTGAKGGLLLAARQDGVAWVSAPYTKPLYERFVAEGWHHHNDRIPRLVARAYPGFLTDADLSSSEERASLPIYRDFLTPLGFDAGAATAMTGLAEDMVILSVEGFLNMEAAWRAVPVLDALRPHMARASILASRFALERARSAVAALASIGSAAAIVRANGRLIASNDLFDTDLMRFGTDTPTGLRLLDAGVDRKLRQELKTMSMPGQGGASLPLRLGDDRAVLHLLPLRGMARDIFTGAAAILLVARPAMPAPPEASLIRDLLDLTPAEAQLARHLAGGGTTASAAQANGTSELTARTQLKRIFAKTGFGRQAELITFLNAVARPGA